MQPKVFLHWTFTFLGQSETIEWGKKHIFSKRNFLEFETISLTHSPFSALKFLHTLAWRIPILVENGTFCVGDSLF